MSGSGIIGVVLAGGESLRMGQDKAGLVWNGQSLLARAQTILAEAGCTSIWVSGRPDLPNGFADSHRDAGPAHALLDALERLPSDAPGLLALAVDMPLVAVEDLVALTRPAPDHARAWCEHPLPVYLPAHCPRPDRKDVWSIRKLVTPMQIEWLEPSPSRRERLRNVNTPEDFERLQTER